MRCGGAGAGEVWVEGRVVMRMKTRKMKRSKTMMLLMLCRWLMEEWLLTVYAKVAQQMI